MPTHDSVLHVCLSGASPVHPGGGVGVGVGAFGQQKEAGGCGHLGKSAEQSASHTTTVPLPHTLHHHTNMSENPLARLPPWSSSFYLFLFSVYTSLSAELSPRVVVLEITRCPVICKLRASNYGIIR